MQSTTENASASEEWLAMMQEMTTYAFNLAEMAKDLRESIGTFTV